MTDVDFGILAAMVRNPFLSHAGLARAADTSASTVRRRLAALQERGVLRGFAAIPAAEVFGREGWVCDFAQGAGRPVELRELLAVEDVVWADRNHDGSIAVMSYLAPGAALPPPALVEALGARPASWYRYAAPDAPVALSPLDWRVIDATLDEPRASADETALRAGLSTKTARNRKADLVRQGVLDVFPLFGPAKGPGPLYHHLAVYADDPARFPAVVQAAAPALVLHALDDPAGIYLFCRAESLLAQQETQRRVSALPGVTRVRFILNLEFETATHRLRALVAEELRKWDAARRRVRPSPRPPA